MPIRKRGPAPGFRSQTNMQQQEPVANTLAIPRQTSSYSFAASPRPAHSGQEEPFLGIPTSLVDQLLAVYFTHVHNVWPLVCKPVFNSRHTCTHLVLSMLAVAACVAPDAAIEGINSDSLFIMAEQALQRRGQEPRLDVIQSFILLSLRQTGCGDKKSAVMYANRASIMVLALGLHLDPTSSQGRWKENLTYEYDSRARVYWNCYILDKVLAEETGQPFILTYRQSSTPFPSINEVDEFETWPPLPMSSAPLPRSVQHVHPRRGYVLSNFVWTCRLGMIVEEIMDLQAEGPNINNTGEWWDAQFSQYSRDKRDIRRRLDRVAKQLDLWRQSIPSHLLIDVENDVSPLPHHVINITWYHIARILLYSRFLEGNAVHSSARDEDVNRGLRYHIVCSEAAQAVVDLVSLLDKHRLLQHICSDMIHHLSLTTLFEAYETVSIDPARANRAKINFSQCCLWLREISSSWPASSAHRVFFEGLIQGGLQLSSTFEDKSLNNDSREPSPAIEQELQAAQSHLSPPGNQQEPHNIPSSTQPAADHALSNLFQLPQYYWNQLMVNELASHTLSQPSITSEFDSCILPLSNSPKHDLDQGQSSAPHNFTDNTVPTTSSFSVTKTHWDQPTTTVQQRDHEASSGSGEDQIENPLDESDQEAIYSALMAYMVEAIRRP
nr:hypothetical protein L203_03719 [Cryptococcus depauperatus CBS 7841]